MKIQIIFVAALLIAGTAQAETAHEKLKAAFDAAGSPAALADFDDYANYANSDSNQTCLMALDHTTSVPTGRTHVKVLHRTTGQTNGAGPLFPPTPGVAEETLIIGVFSIDPIKYFDTFKLKTTATDLVLRIEKSDLYGDIPTPFFVLFRKNKAGLLIFKMSKKDLPESYGYCYRK